jgi:hypothetical protein
MRLKVNVNGATACARACLLQSKNFGVLDALECVKARTNEIAAAIGNDRPHASARRSQRGAAARKLQGLAHEPLVLFRRCHVSTMKKAAKLCGGEQ